MTQWNSFDRIRPRIGALTFELLVALIALISVPSYATVFELPEDGSPIIGTDSTITTRHGDTILDVARQYSLGYEEILRVNPGVDLWLPGDGTSILLPGRRLLPPGPHEGVIVNLAENRLYYFPKPKKNEKPVVITYPVSVGKIDRETPLGSTSIVSKRKNPAWHPPESIRKEHAARGEPLPRVVPAGPDNPLGDFAMRLGLGDGTYLIHGTNNPVAVGMAVTHGCVRMYPEDIAALFPLVPVGTKVRLINEPVKLAQVNGELWLEAHPYVDLEGQAVDPDFEVLRQKLDRTLGSTLTAIHWEVVQATVQGAKGMPTLIGLQAYADSSLATAAPGAP
jgi:L,D-transpeptidase ErfK/SrfK